MREIRFYHLPSGRRPVEEFLDSLSPRLAEKVTWVLGLIEELEIVPLQYFKKLEGSSNLWEVRASVGRESVRILGFLHRSRLVVLTHGFLKKSQRLSRRDIELAEKRKADYLRREK